MRHSSRTATAVAGVAIRVTGRTMPCPTPNDSVAMCFYVLIGSGGSAGQSRRGLRGPDARRGRPSAAPLREQGGGAGGGRGSPPPPRGGGGGVGGQRRVWP